MSADAPQQSEAPQAGQTQKENLHLDEATGEYVSKSELKRRMKQREKEKAAAEKAAAKASSQAGAQSSGAAGQEAAPKAEEVDPSKYFDNRCTDMLELQKSGRLNPWPYKFEVSHTLAQVRSQYFERLKAGEEIPAGPEGDVRVAGRIVSVRAAGKKLVFYTLQARDASIQIFCQRQDSGDAADAAKEHTYDWDLVHSTLRRGDVVGAVGRPMLTKTGELSVAARDLVLLSPCLRMLPLGRNVMTDPDVRFRNRALDLFVNGTSELVVKRSEIIRFIRNFMHDEYGFFEVETPILQTIHGGATAEPFETRSNDLGHTVYLRIAPELYLKRLIVGGIERVFDIGKNFRNESSDQTHSPEFTMMEAYASYWDLYDMQRLIERLCESLVRWYNKTFNGLAEDDPRSTRVKFTSHKGQEYDIDFKAPWKKVSMIAEMEKILGKTFPRPLDGPECHAFLEKLLEEHGITCAVHTTNKMLDKLSSTFLETLTPNPLFVMDHPAVMSPLAKPHRSLPEMTERFEVFVANFEIANAYTELNNSLIQRANFEKQLQEKEQGDVESMKQDDEFCRALDYGMPPTGGIGVGIDRLIMILTGQGLIREIIPFPLMANLSG